MGIFEWFWSPKGSPANCNSPIPEGWTDDMRVPLPVGKTVHQLVDQILTAFEQDRDDTAILEGLQIDLGVDRVRGGMTRAATGDADNAPDPTKDPIAWVSYRRSLGKQ